MLNGEALSFKASYSKEFSSLLESVDHSKYIDYELETYLAQKKYLRDKKVLNKVYKLVRTDHSFDPLNLKQQVFLAHYSYISNVVVVKKDRIIDNYYSLPFDIVLMKNSYKKFTATIF